MSALAFENHAKLVEGLPLLTGTAVAKLTYSSYRKAAPTTHLSSPINQDEFFDVGK